MAPLVGGWANGFGATTAAGGSNPFPGAVAGVYTVANAGDLTAKPANSVALVPGGDLWISGGGGVWPQLISPVVIADASELPTPAAGVVFSTSCLIEDQLGNKWRGNGGSKWIRIVCAPVADFNALPSPLAGKEDDYPMGLGCLTLDLLVTYYWLGSEWVVPS